ncbi:hypothetical protein DRO59_03380 [Candidatus Bathyarchaeota archaeon]|nr:MAG: hypothetical protein DRO59_03380 [Candidatus Bathyarchaeota archaeon]
MRLVAVLSSVVATKDGVYKVRTKRFEQVKPLVRGLTHYVGHVSTREFLESLGAVRSSSPFFRGLRVGESALVVTLKRNTSRELKGFTTGVFGVKPEDLRFRILTRVK